MKKIRDTKYFITEDGKVISPFGRVMTPWRENNSGYLLVRLRKNKKVLCVRLHRVLAEAYIPNPDGKGYVKHKNDDKTDNSLSNLEWGERPDNTKEGYDNGCYKFFCRSHNVKAVSKVTGEVFEDKSIRKLSETLGLNRKNITAVLKGIKRNTYDYEFYYVMPND